MIALIGAVLGASLLGSLHCAGMCGAFAMIAVGGPEQTARHRALANAAYNAGRLATYTLLGAVAGTVGATLDLGGSVIGAQRIAAVVAGAGVAVFGVIQILRLRGVRVARPPAPRALVRFVERAHGAVFGLPGVTRALCIGLLTTLLPCGWLYAFAITAGGTGSPALGAATMAVFWVGTLPIMVGIGAGLGSLAGRLGDRLPMLTAGAMVCVGLAMVGLRFAPDFEPTSLRGAVTIDPVSAEVRVIDQETLPCCDDDP